MQMVHVDCTMTTCVYNHDRECTKDRIFMDINPCDKSKPVGWCYKKDEVSDMQ